MKLTLPLLLASSAAAFAQVSPLHSQASPNFAVGANYFDVRGGDYVDYNGYTLGLRAKVTKSISVVATYGDSSSDRVYREGFYDDGIVAYAAQGEAVVEVKRYSLGFESSQLIGPGLLTAGIAYADSTSKGKAWGSYTDFTGPAESFSVSSDLVDNTQIVLSLKYELEIAKGLNLGFGLTHFFNDFSYSNNDAKVFFDTLGYTLNDDDVTAPSITLSYSPIKVLTLHMSYSTEDIALGLPDADGSFTVGVRLNF